MGPENETNGQMESKKEVREREKKEEVEQKGKERKERSTLTAITDPVSKGSIHQGNPRGAASPQRDLQWESLSQAGQLCWGCICQILCANTETAPR